MRLEELLVNDGYVTTELDAIGFCGYNNSVLCDPDLVLRSSFSEIPSLDFEHWRDLEDLNMRELNILLHLSANLYNASLTKNNINKECEVICVESCIEPTLYIDPEVLDKMVPKHSVKKHEHIFNKSSKLVTEKS